MQTPSAVPYESTIPEMSRLRAGINWRFPIKIRNFETMLRPLSIVELEHIEDAVNLAMSKLSLDNRTEKRRSRYNAKETIKLATTSDVGKYDNTISDPMLDSMTVDELLYVYSEWTRIMEHVNPALEKMPREQLAQMVEVLKKKLSGPSGFDSDRVLYIATRESGNLLSDQKRLTHGQVVWWVAHAIVDGKFEWRKA